MNQEKFGHLIKEIRKKNNLTQKDLADKYNVTYQAVSKWENGKNLPDITLMREISRDFNVSMDDLIDGNFGVKKNNKIITFAVIAMFLVLLVIIFFLIKNSNSDLKSRPISTTCNDFNIYGIISYNEKNSSIYIPKIEYCGNNKDVYFETIECTLYEKSNDITKKISSYNHIEDNGITLDDFLKNV